MADMMKVMAAASTVTADVAAKTEEAIEQHRKEGGGKRGSYASGKVKSEISDRVLFEMLQQVLPEFPQQ